MLSRISIFFPGFYKKYERFFFLIHRLFSFLLFWIYFNNFLLLLVRINLMKLGIFGVYDFFVCLIRSYALVLPHYLNFFYFQNWKVDFNKKYSLKSYLKLTKKLRKKLQNALKKYKVMNQKISTRNKQKNKRKRENKQASILKEFDDEVKNYKNKFRRTLKQPLSKTPRFYKIAFRRFEKDIQKAKATKK